MNMFGLRADGFLETVRRSRRWRRYPILRVSFLAASSLTAVIKRFVDRDGLNAAAARASFLSSGFQRCAFVWISQKKGVERGWSRADVDVGWKHPLSIDAIDISTQAIMRPPSIHDPHYVWSVAGSAWRIQSVMEAAFFEMETCGKRTLDNVDLMECQTDGKWRAHASNYSHGRKLVQRNDIWCSDGGVFFGIRVRRGSQMCTLSSLSNNVRLSLHHVVRFFSEEARQQSLHSLEKVQTSARVALSLSFRLVFVSLFSRMDQQQSKYKYSNFDQKKAPTLV